MSISKRCFEYFSFNFSFVRVLGDLALRPKHLAWLPSVIRQTEEMNWTMNKLGWFLSILLLLHKGFLSLLTMGYYSCISLFRIVFLIFLSIVNCLYFSRQRAASVFDEITRLSNRPRHEEKLDSLLQTSCNRFLLLWSKQGDTQNYICWWIEGEKILLIQRCSINKGHFNWSNSNADQLKRLFIWFSV